MLSAISSGHTVMLSWHGVNKNRIAFDQLSQRSWRDGTGGFLMSFWTFCIILCKLCDLCKHYIIVHKKKGLKRDSSSKTKHFFFFLAKIKLTEPRTLEKKNQDPQIRGHSFAIRPLFINSTHIFLNCSLYILNRARRLINRTHKFPIHAHAFAIRSHSSPVPAFTFS